MESGYSYRLFTRNTYLEEEQTKYSSAANTMNKAIAGYLGAGAPTSHSFRHTFMWAYLRIMKVCHEGMVLVLTIYDGANVCSFFMV